LIWVQNPFLGEARGESFHHEQADIAFFKRGKKEEERFVVQWHGASGALTGPARPDTISDRDRF